MRASERGRARLVYVLGEFPSVSETFILREMRALEAMGFYIIPLSMEPAEEGAEHADATELAAKTVYRPDPLSGKSAWGMFKTMLRRPLGFWGTFVFMLLQCIRQPRVMRELLSAFIAAAFFASVLSPRNTRHIHSHFASYPTTVGLFLAGICTSGFSISCHARDIFTDSSILLAKKLEDADFIVVCTRHGMERLLHDYPLICGEKLHLVYHGVEAAKLLAVPRVEYPVPMILSVGRLVEKKGFPFLLQAAAVLAGQGIDFELVIVGDGPDRDELERLAGGLGLRDRVVMTGMLSQEELSHVYRRSDVFCLASIVGKDGDRDGLPNVILEAMAYRVPVVASNLSAIPEVVIDEETGLLVPPGNPAEIAARIERVLSDRSLHASLVRNAARKVQRDFDAVRNAHRLGKLFAESLGLQNWPVEPLQLPENDNRPIIEI